ncbi:MAG: cobalamin-dependent protein [Candidatus Thorarchaeota archaeon]|nr:MAG: cobalamin-dependent protein [Candidatus Thorarchaeota archaeon]
MTLEDISRKMIELDIDNIGEAVKAELDAGAAPGAILNALTSGLDEVGRRYESSEYFLAELVLAGETVKDALAVLEPHLKSDESEVKDRIVVATVRGDNHDIGKNLLITMLLSSGLEIIDLGMDCPSEKIVETVREAGARVVALSCLLTMTLREISVVDQALKEAGLRDGVKIIVGGAPLNMELAKELGADDFGADAIEGVRRIRALLEG